MNREIGASAEEEVKEKRGKKQSSKNVLQRKLHWIGKWAVKLLLNDLRTDNLTRCERVKDTVISIQIPLHQCRTCWWVWPGAGRCQWFPSFLKESSLKSLESGKKVAVYGSSIINTSKRKTLFSSLYSEVKFAQIMPTWNAMNKLWLHQYPHYWAPSIFFFFILFFTQ